MTFDYGTELTAEDIERLSAVDSITRISMGYAGVDSEYVTMEGSLLKLGRLKNLQDVHLNKESHLASQEKVTVHPADASAAATSKSGE